MGNIGISEKAAAQLREQIIKSCLEAGIGFRMEVSTDESGEPIFSIRIDRQQSGDEVMVSGGVKVLLDPASAARISDYQLDYQGKPGGGFSLGMMQEAKHG